MFAHLSNFDVIEVEENHFARLVSSKPFFKIFENDYSPIRDISPKSLPLQEWKLLPNLGNYKISPDGLQVFSIKRGIFIIPTVWGKYKIVSLYDDDSVRKTYHIHSLVALLYVKNPDPAIYTEIDHISGDRLDNRAENLRWVTPLQNVRHAIELGLKNSFTGRSKINRRQLTEIRKSALTADVLGKKYHMHPAQIRKIKSGATYKNVPNLN